MAVVYKYGKRSFIKDVLRGIVQIDTTDFHGTISASNLTPESGEQIFLKAIMEEGYTLKCFVVDDENIAGNSFTAHLGTNYIKALEAVSATQEVLQKPVVILKDVLSMSSDNLKLYTPYLYIDSVLSSFFDPAPSIKLNPAGLAVLEVTTEHTDELKQLEITSIVGKWTTSSSTPLYQMTIWASKESMNSDLYINGTKTTLYIGSWTSSGNVCFYLGYFAKAQEGKTYSFNLKKSGYKESPTVIHVVPEIENQDTSKSITIYTYVKEYNTGSYPSTATNVATVSGTSDDTYTSIFNKSSLSEPAYLDSSKCSYSYSTGICKIYGWNNYEIVKTQLKSPSVSGVTGEYWLSSSTSGSVAITARITNPNSVDVVATVVVTYSGSGQMSSYSTTSAISANGVYYFSTTRSISQPSAGETITVTAYLSGVGYNDSAAVSSSGSLTLRK